jgi:hypothetical protein
MTAQRRSQQGNVSHVEAEMVLKKKRKFEADVDVAPEHPDEITDDEDDHMDCKIFSIDGSNVRELKSCAIGVVEEIKKITVSGDRNVVVKLIVPENFQKLVSSIVKKSLQEFPEEIPGELVLKVPQNAVKSRVSFNICSMLNGWQGGEVDQDSLIMTNANQLRAPDVEWRQTPLTLMTIQSAQKPMPDLWIEICHNRPGDRDEAFAKISDHVPSISTVFVAIVLSCRLTEASKHRMGVMGPHTVPPVHPAPEMIDRPRMAPYMAVWSLHQPAPVFYNIRRGHYINITLPQHPPIETPILQFDMDWIAVKLQVM